MAIVFNCPHCGELHRVKDDLAGKVGKCKRAACRQQILIPTKSTIPANGVPTSGPIDAEALAAAAFSDEVKAQPKEEAQVKKISIACPGCENKFEVDSAMQGKNTRCPGCGHVFRVPKIIEDKPADWRANKSVPSLAKTTEPVPSGVWETQAKGVSVKSLKEAGVDVVEDDEDASERRLRRIKQLFYGLALLGMIAFVVLYLMRTRREGKEEKWMEMAVKEIDSKEEGSKRPEFKAAIYRLAAEYRIRSFKKREDLDESLKQLREARTLLQDLPVAQVDRNGMLLELALAFTNLGGDLNEVNDEKRLPWEKVQPEIRKTLNLISATEKDLRIRSLRLLTRRLAGKDQGMLAYNIARSCTNDTELPDMVGLVGIELVLAGKKDMAQQVLNKAPPTASPELTALWLALHPSEQKTPANFPQVPAATGALSRDARLAYAEGYALQGKIAEGRAIAESPGGTIFDRFDALLRVAAVAVETGKNDKAGPIIDYLVPLLNSELKAKPPNAWVTLRLVELAARLNKMEAVQTALDSMKDESVKSWARLEVLRIKLASQPKARADETWVESIDRPETAALPAALARMEVSRHNAAAGETNYTRSIEAFPKGTIRPFGYAGTALGAQDRNMK